MNAAMQVPAAAALNAIRVHEVSYRYRQAQTQALNGISLDIPSGEIFGLLGPNGAGKSTLLGLLSGSLELQHGSIVIADEPLPRRAMQVKRMSAIVPQEYAFYESLSGEQNLEYFGRVFGLKRSLRAQRSAQAVEVCRLGEHMRKPAGTYSGGLKRRMNLAIGLLNAPRILYLDEPTVGIDAESRRYIIDAVHALKNDGTTIIYTSHYMEEVEQLCDSVAVIDHGRVVLQDRMERLLRREGSDAMQLTLTSPSADLVVAFAPFGATHVNFKRWTLTVPRERVQEVFSIVERAGAHIDRLQYGVNRLEEIYLELLLAPGDEP